MMPRRSQRGAWESGQSLVETAVVLALISIVTLVVLKGLGQNTTARLAETRDAFGGQADRAARPNAADSSDK